VAKVIIVVKDPCDFDDSASSCDILVHNAITPNNDGINEVFVIDRIENYPTVPFGFTIFGVC
jgi:hypothetical protein